MRMQLGFYLLIFILFPSLANAKNYVLNCQDNSLLFPRQTLSTNLENVDVIANNSQISKKGDYLLSGDVALNSNKYYLAADEIKLQKKNNTTTAVGNVRFQDQTLMSTGDRVLINKQDDVFVTTLEQVKFHYPETKINGTAQKIISHGNQQILNSANYTLCPLNNTDWRLKAEQIILNSKTNKGIAKNVTIEFLSLPVFYLSYYEWTLKGRSSGFLLPTLSIYSESTANKKNNSQIKIPYYFNLAADRDFLLTLNELSNRGLVIEGKYRQLISANNYWDDGRIEIEVHYLHKDKINKNNRWLLRSKLDLTLNKKTDLKIITNLVSEKDYFKEITRRDTHKTSLNSQLNLEYKDPVEKLKMKLFTESKQLINNGTADYIRASEFSISKTYQNISDYQLNLSLVSTKFKHKNANTTAHKTRIRTHTQSSISRSIITNAYSITPKITLSNTQYKMDNMPNQSRSIASFSLDSKLFLERSVNIFNKNLTQTLTPKVAYYYSKKNDQSTLPNFDSAYKHASYENFFSGRKFIGTDRISNVNTIIAGLESDFIDEQTGNTYLSLKTAQKFHFNDTDINNAGLLTNHRKYSNIVLSADTKINQITFNNSLQYDPQVNQINKRDSSITYLLDPKKIFTIGHYDDKKKKSRFVELYGAYPINSTTHIFSGINRSLSNKITNKIIFGVSYESCCWAVRIARSRKHEGGYYDNKTSFELVLKGLASTSSNLYKNLEEDVPNYLVNFNEF